MCTRVCVCVCVCVRFCCCCCWPECFSFAMSEHKRDGPTEWEIRWAVKIGGCWTVSTVCLTLLVYIVSGTGQSMRQQLRSCCCCCCSCFYCHRLCVYSRLFGMCEYVSSLYCRSIHCRRWTDFPRIVYSVSVSVWCCTHRNSTAFCFGCIAARAPLFLNGKSRQYALNMGEWTNIDCYTFIMKMFSRRTKINCILCLEGIKSFASYVIDILMEWTWPIRFVPFRPFCLNGWSKTLDYDSLLVYSSYCTWEGDWQHV